MKTKNKRIWWTVYEVSYAQLVWKLTINERLCNRQTQVTPTLQQFKFAAARLSQTTRSLDGAQVSSGSDEAAQLLHQYC